MKKVVFWDFHGTLIKPNSLWSTNLWKSIQQEDGYKHITLQQIRKYTRSCYTWDMPEKEYPDEVGEIWWKNVLDGFEKVFIDLGVDGETAKRSTLRFREIVKKPENYQLYDDTIKTLKGCIEKGYDNYLLSNNYPDLDDMMDKLELSKYFEGMIISAKIGYEKPRKEIFDYALKSAGYPEVSYMVGDSITADVRGGNESNIKTILVHSGVSEEASYSFDDLISILGVLK